jgi:hypothetical protein
MMIEVNISKYEGRKYDGQVGREIEESKGVTGKAGNYNKIVCDAEEMSAYLTPARELKQYLATQCLPIGDGRYLLLVDKYAEVAQKIMEYKDKFWKGVGTFCNNFDEIIEKQKYRLNDLWKIDDYPKNIASKFNINIHFSPVPDASAVRQYTGLPADEVDRMVKENEDAIKNMIETAMKNPYKRIVEVVNKMVEKLSDEGARFKNSLVDNIKEVVELLPQLNIIKSKDLDDIADRLNQELCSVSPDALRYDLNKRKETVEKAEKIMADLEGYF